MRFRISSLIVGLVFSTGLFPLKATAGVRLDFLEDPSGPKVTLSSAKRLEEKVRGVLEDTAAEFSRIFKYNPQRAITLRIKSAAQFRKQVSSTHWSSAMYYKGEIVLLYRSGKMNVARLRRSIRHEYVHALVDDLSGFRSPAWFEEGLAQMLEGPPNSVLGPALRLYLRKQRAMPLTSLVDGFHLLDSNVVPAAYGQSLFAVRSLVNRFGFVGVRRFLRAMREGQAPEPAFRSGFGLSQDEFERTLLSQLLRWRDSNAKQP